MVFLCRKHTRVTFCKTKPFVFLVGDLNPYPFLGTNISLQKRMFEDDVPFPKVGYVSSLDGIFIPLKLTQFSAFFHGQIIVELFSPKPRPVFFVKRR